MSSAAQANRSYFQEAYRTGRHGWEIEDPSPYAREFLSRLRRTIPGGRLLDAGCGEGRHAILAAGLGFRVTAVDFEPLALERARRLAKMKGAEGIIFRTANILKMPAPTIPFDVVLDYGCLHHQKKADWPAYKAFVFNTLCPRGFFVLSVFGPRFALFHGSSRNWHIARGAYRRYFTRDDFLGLFGGEFEVLEMIEEDGGRPGFWHALFRRRT
jgi:SAM-dependent methyltransferase